MRIILISFFVSLSALLAGRSIHRPVDPHAPKIEFSWVNDKKKFSISDSHIEEYPFFKIYNADYVSKHNLPDEKIPFRNEPDNSIEGEKLKSMISCAIAEIRAHKKTFTHFTVLQKKDFNEETMCGLIVLKCKEYPFVVKLFLETPGSMIEPFNKGIEPIFFFFMGGGTNRHLTGFTRLRNRELVLEKIKQNDRWANFVDIPNKWFWIPPESKLIAITGTNVGKQPQQRIEIPSIYCIIADAIDADQKFTLSNPQDRTLALQLCNDLEILIDPHIKNFMIEKKTKKLVIVDTEHFPTVVGLKTDKPFRSYTQWYFHLVSKFTGDLFLRTKQTRRLAQINPQGRFLTYD